MSAVKIGFVGVGGMGQCAHLKNYVTVPDCEVVAIAEIRPELRRRVAAKYHIPGVYATYQDMLAAEKLDGLVAPQPFTRHGTLIPELAKYGLPILTEKPLAGCAEAGQRILNALTASGSWQMVGYHKRSDPATMYTRSLIEELTRTRELGALRYVRILMPAGDWVANGFLDLISTSDPMPPLEWDAPASDMDKETFDKYISFVNYYIHQVNLMRYLLCESYHVKFADRSGVLLAVESDSGVTGAIEMTPYQTTVDWQESALVAFERGWIKLELPAPLASNRPGRVEVYRDPGGGVTPMTASPTLPWVHAMRQQAMNFVAAIKGERKPPCDAFEAMLDLKVAREYIRLWTGK